MQKHFLFTSLGQAERDSTVDVMVNEAVAAGSTIITQGSPGDKFYVIQAGECLVDVNGEQVAVLRGGDSFGELALLYDSPRAATVRAATSCTLWTLDRLSFRRVIASTASSAMAARCAFLSNVPLLRPLS
ncbi:MAG: cyclic nucleotide-binding domain-containing protein, partial [Hydrogenophaga sp.]